MKTSRTGYARCPGCLSHVKVIRDTECPFCGEPMEEAETIGGGVIHALKSSRSALIALGLAGGVSFALACGTGTSDDGEIDPNQDYGGFDPGDEIVDAGADGGDVGPDMGSEEEEIDPNQDYGGFDPENVDPGPDVGVDAGDESGDDAG